MNKEKKLWIVLVVLLISILFIIFVVVKYRKDNNVDKNKEEVNLYEILIEEKNWICLYSYYYPLDGEEQMLETANFELNFDEEYVERCVKDSCERSTYKINGDILTINDLEVFRGDFIIKYKDNNLILEQKRVIGTKVEYYFGYPMG